MDGLDEFEKNLAAEKTAREEEERERRHGKHRHRRRDDSVRHRHRDRDGDRDGHRRHRRHEDDEGHRHKRSRHSKDEDEDRHRHHRSRHGHGDDKHSKHDDAKADLPLPDDEKPPAQDSVDNAKASDSLVRDAWMTAPSAIAVEHIHRPDRKPKPPPEEPKRVIHSRELNRSLGTELEPSLEQAPSAFQRKIDYTFGDRGSSWRMTKLKAVYTAAEESGRTVDVALERYGNLEEFDDAREEKNELERRKIYGQGYRERDTPTGELYRERQRKETPQEAEPNHEPEQGTVIPDDAVQAASTDRTALNRLRAQMMKAKLRRAPDAAKLEGEYNRAAAALASGPPSAPEAVVLGAMESRQLAGPRGEVKAVTTRRGRERGQVEENDDMTIEDMMREERRTKGEAGGAGKRMAERIARDSKFTDDLEYMDDNAAKLARRVHKSEVNLKSMAVQEVQKMSRALDRCPLCHHEDTGRPPVAPVVSLGTRAYLTLATEPEVTPGGAVIVPLAHRANLLECDDDEWEEVRNFMKSLTRMYHDQGRDVVFYEDAAAGPRRRAHAAMVAAPVPYDRGATAPAFFREALLAAGDEWSQHAKVVDTAALASSSSSGGGRTTAFRRSFAREAPYFHAWFSLDGGLGRVVDDPAAWPRGDTFAREILAAIVDAEPHLARKQGRWTPGDAARVEGFRRAWRRFDWTRVLAEP